MVLYSVAIGKYEENFCYNIFTEWFLWWKYLTVRKRMSAQ